MLTLLPSRRQTARRRQKCTTLPDRLRVLYQQILDDGTIAQSAQRAAAGGRHTIVESQYRLHRQHRRPDRTAPALPSSRAGRRRLAAGLAARLDVIHRRLLLLSSSIELENDRLDVLCAELQQLLASDDVGSDLVKG